MKLKIDWKRVKIEIGKTNREAFDNNQGETYLNYGSDSENDQKETDKLLREQNWTTTWMRDGG